MPSIGSLKINLGLNTTQLIKDLKRSEFLLKRSAAKYKAIGSSLTNTLTVPILGAAAASAKLATDLGTNFSKIENLVGISGTTLDDFKNGVSSISSVVGKSQSELSGALFAVTSAGLRGSEALEVLQQSAKASQIGLGDVTAIAKASTAVLNAYGKENISAARATDILTGIVREGNVEASSLAPTLGSIIGTAQTLGISFEEVGANIATFTRLGVGAEESVTGLKSVMNAFLKPGKEAKKVLAELGLTSQDVRDSIRNDGLANTLIDLKGRLGGNVEALGALIPNVRALSNVLGTAGSQADTYKNILDNLAGSTGIVDDAFGNVTKTAGFQFKAALVNLQNAAIDLGNILLPTITKIVSGVSGLISRFRALDDGTKKNIVRFAAFAAAIGPVLSGIGTLKSVAATAIGVLRGLITSVAAIGAPIAITIGVLAAGAIYVANNWETVRDRIVDSVNYMIQLYNESIAVRSIVNIVAGAFEIIVQNVKDAVAAFKILGGAVGDILSGNLGIGDAFSKAADELTKQGEESAENIRNIFNEKLTNVIDPKELIKIDASDVDNAMAPFTDWYNNIKKSVTSLLDFGGGGGGSVGADIETGASGETQSRGAIEVPEIGGIIPTLVSPKTLEGLDNLKIKLGEVKNEGLDLTDVIKDGLANALTSMGENIGQAVLHAQNFGEGLTFVAAGIADSLLDILANVGKLAIQTGISVAGIKAALKSLNPAVAIAGGVALIALTKVVKAKLANSTPKFANGGVITGPTYGLMGEYAGANTPGRSEIVTPEQLMRKIVREEGGGGGVTQIRGVIRQRELHLINDATAYNTSRSTFTG